MGTDTADGFYWTREPWGTALRSIDLGRVASHFFTSGVRLRGSEAEEARDWASLAATIGVSPDRLFRLHQVHGNHVVVVRAGEGRRQGAGQRRPDGDITISNDPGIALVVQVADCVPLLLADTRSGAVSVAHAGWRGTAANVAGTAVAALHREFGARPEDLVVAHGPSIGPCCYEVGESLVQAFSDGRSHPATDRWFARDQEGRLRLDLWTANRDQLLAAGVRPENIHQAGLCTFRNPELFHSYRRDGKGTGRIAGVIRAQG